MPKKIIKGLPIVLSAPSGGGKTTIAARLLGGSAKIIRSISFTTRQPRRGEKNGVDYYFVSEDEFKKRIAEKQFLEWAEVHGNFYGTPIDVLTQQMEKGKHVLLVIDPQGAVAVRRVYPEGVFIFLVPPKWEVLKRRLIGRGTDQTKVIKLRIANAKKELSYLSQYDYLVLNNRRDQAVADVKAIIRTEPLRISRLKQRDIPIFKESKPLNF